LRERGKGRGEEVPSLFIADRCLAGGGRVRVRGGDRRWEASGSSWSAARGRRRVWQAGPRRQREREEEDRTNSGNTPGGLWAGFGAGPNRSPAAFYSFSDFLFPFSNFLNSVLIQIICNLFQIDSNKILYYPNIQLNVLKQ
jgi:hypothetical protein